MPITDPTEIGRTMRALVDAMDERMRAAGFDGDPFDCDSNEVVSPLPFNRWVGHRLRLIGAPPQVVHRADTIDRAGNAVVLARLDELITERIAL